jgi:DNA polymerase IV (DinB-like DNA polymerase)
VVTTASYAARKYGIRSAMPISRAWRLGEAARRRGEPGAVFLPGNRRLLLARGADSFEEASIDEAYLDLSSREDFERAEDHARPLKAEIGEQEGPPARWASHRICSWPRSDFKKPDGLK